MGIALGACYKVPTDGHRFRDSWMALSGFVSATALLLLLPGPTNTLLALAGGERGFLRAIPLVRYELCAYLVVVAMLSTVGGQFSTIIPHFSEAVAMLSGTWVAVLAIRLWPRSGIEI
jgi:threonine/homoserine/homoserine lactone efflux protein